eukprot:2188574-Amphidinium_carterae.1
MFNDEIDQDELLHEGVLLLYWMTIESIKNLRTRARSGKDPEAEKQLNEYIEDNMKLDFRMKDEEEKDKGAIEEREDFQRAKHRQDAEAAQEIVY